MTITAAEPGQIRVYDGEGRLYHQSPDHKTTVTISGAIGTHVVTRHDTAGVEQERTTFKVNCQTSLDDEGGRFKKLMLMLQCTFTRKAAQPKIRVSDGERIYHLHILTSRDTIYSIKGAAYFYGYVKDVIDLFGDNQREDGMIFDFARSVDPGIPRHMEWRFKPEFSKRINHDRTLFARQPVMNDLEHMYIQGLHMIWKFTGDDAWMESRLDNALGAMRYARTSPYTWSEKYQLIKRPYCLDLWDFQSKFDAEHIGGDAMDAIPGKTVYGIFHGDNTGMADGCRKLAEMCEQVGRDEDARDAREFAEHIQTRLDELAWNGEFYTHHVSEDPSFERDFGVDESTQVSLSNAYAINRGIGHEKAKAIIETYLRIRRDMPEDCPAEFFQMYPPFPRGWSFPPWVYTNGAVTPLVAGELAHGAYEHGYEDYASDILKRTLELFEPYGDSFINGLHGRPQQPPEGRILETLDLRPLANTGLVCTENKDGWTGDPGNDMRELPTGKQTFESIDFEIIPNDQNDGNNVIRLAKGNPGWAESVDIPVGKPFGSLYLLHACSGSGRVIGELDYLYEDGTSESMYIERGKDVETFWNPPLIEEKPQKNKATFKMAWRGKNENISNIGLTVRALDNPCPDKTVKAIRLRAAHGRAQWLLVGATVSNKESFLSQVTFGGGAPPNWSCGAVMYALAEGLMGVKDEGRNLDALRLSPRWLSADVNKTTVCLKYAEAGGYVRYTYRRDGDRFELHLAASAGPRSVELLLPKGKDVAELRLDGQPADYEIRTIEQSRYACLQADGPEARHIELTVQ